MTTLSKPVLLDAGVLIGALLLGDPRHTEARPLVEAARGGTLTACTTVGILSEVYAALTWIGAQPVHSPAEAAQAVRLLIEPPSALSVLSDNLDAASVMLELVAQNQLTARRVHDARHAATADAWRTPPSSRSCRGATIPGNTSPRKFCAPWAKNSYDTPISLQSVFCYFLPQK
ncbi:MAG: type II toxin-antitoxin system VapC family toxin [Anaerolineae bacterium]|nr:type II toxin-antitoxin system VapC family toxin [Anaerolineae bacterium]